MCQCATLVYIFTETNEEPQGIPLYIQTQKEESGALLSQFLFHYSPSYSEKEISLVFRKY